MHTNHFIRTWLLDFPESDRLSHRALWKQHALHASDQKAPLIAKTSMWGLRGMTASQLLTKCDTQRCFVPFPVYVCSTGFVFRTS